MIGRNEREQRSFYEVGIEGRRIKNEVLEGIEGLVDWTPMVREVEQTYAKRGRPSHDPLVMIKIMVLQHLYNLSDSQTEEMIKDRLSFARFVGVSLQDEIPDETSICRFRQRMIECGLEEDLLGMINVQLEEKGYLLRTTTLIDASLIRASRNAPRKDEKPKDLDASHTVRGDQTYYGYKAHVAADEKHTLIQKAVLTTAKEHDSNRFEEMLHGKEKAVYADKGYCDKVRKTLLRKKGIKERIMDRAWRDHPLTRWQKKRNKLISKVRGKIERIFAHLKTWQGYRRVRYVGLARNQLELTLKSVAYNLKRVVQIQQTETA